MYKKIENIKKNSFFSVFFLFLVIFLFLVLRRQSIKKIIDGSVHPERAYNAGDAGERGEK